MWSTCLLQWWVISFEMEQSPHSDRELTPFQGVGAIENQAVYVASKHFIEGLSKSLRKEGLLDGVKVGN